MCVCVQASLLTSSARRAWWLWCEDWGRARGRRLRYAIIADAPWRPLGTHRFTLAPMLRRAEPGLSLLKRFSARRMLFGDFGAVLSTFQLVLRWSFAHMLRPLSAQAMLLLLVGVMALNFATMCVLSGLTIRRRNRGRFLSVSSIP